MSETPRPDPWKDVKAFRVPGSFPLYVASEVDAARAADAEQIARLSAQVEVQKDLYRVNVESMEKLTDTLRAERDAAQQQIAACTPYLKDGEMPAECIARNRADTDAVLSLLTQSKQQIATLTEVLHQARLQLEYLDGKFQPTGTTAGVLAQIGAALSTRPQEQKLQVHRMRWQPRKGGLVDAHCACGVHCSDKVPEAVQQWFEAHLAATHQQGGH